MLLNVLVIMACLLENYTTKLSCGIISLVVGVIVILKMLYQLFKIPTELLGLVCISVSLIQFNHLNGHFSSELRTISILITQMYHNAYFHRITAQKYP